MPSASSQKVIGLSVAATATAHLCIRAGEACKLMPDTLPSRLVHGVSRRYCWMASSVWSHFPRGVTVRAQSRQERVFFIIVITLVSVALVTLSGTNSWIYFLQPTPAGRNSDAWSVWETLCVELSTGPILSLLGWFVHQHEVMLHKQRCIFFS